MSSEKIKEKKKIASLHVYRQEKELPNVKTSCCIYVRYTDTPYTDTPYHTLMASFKFLGGAASWLVACKSNKYEVIVHGQNNSIDLFMGG